MNQVRRNAGLPEIEEGDPFARQSKRNLANPKERMSLINKEDKMGAPKYEEVEMPHHLPETEKPEGTPELSEDGARIIELARFKR